MKARSRHFFSILLVLVAAASYAQDPGEKIDTLIVSDTVRISPEIIKLDRDTLKIPMDSVLVTVDTVQIQMDSITVRRDTVVAPADTIQFLQDSIEFAGEKTPLLKESIVTEFADSSAVNQDDNSGKRKTRNKESQKPLKEHKEKRIASSGIGVFFDYGKLVTLPSNFESKAEGGFTINVGGRIMALAEIGYGKIMPAEAIKNGNYISEGLYARGGIAYGGEILPKAFLYFGFMYGTSRFEDSGTISIESQAWENLDAAINRSDLEASWFEVIIISETEFKQNLFLGSKWRLRKLSTFKNDYDPIIYSIPGYGRSFDDTIPAINLYIKYRFPF